MVLALAVLLACVEPAVQPEPALLTPSKSTIPQRLRGALTGSQFMRSIRGLSQEERESAILREIGKGNIPRYLRNFRPVKLSMTRGSGKVVQAVAWVMPDYLAIGSDGDFVRVPMNPITAQRVADQFGCSLPTKKLVDEVYRQAQVHLLPQPMPAGPEMVSDDYFFRHNQTIQRQLGSRPGDVLVAGHKKDVVITQRLTSQPRRVAIYGWHRTDGSPIQPLSLVHGFLYADYSHGIRLVNGTMLVDGHYRSIQSVMRDPDLSPLVSDEGALSVTRFQVSDEAPGPLPPLAELEPGELCQPPETQRLFAAVAQ